MVSSVFSPAEQTSSVFSTALERQADSIEEALLELTNQTGGLAAAQNGTSAEIEDGLAVLREKAASLKKRAELLKAKIAAALELSKELLKTLAAAREAVLAALPQRHNMTFSAVGWSPSLQELAKEWS